MNVALRRKLGAIATAALLTASALVYGGTTAASAACTPSDVSSSVSNLKIEETSGGDGVLVAWEQVRLSFSGALPQGGCSGDSITITVPDSLRTFAGTYDLKAPDGTVTGTMVVKGGVITVTFNDYIETHTDYTYSGWISMQVTNTLKPGQNYDLAFSVGGKVWKVPVETGPCTDGCDGNPTVASKWANWISGSSTTIEWGIESVKTQTAGETIKITEVVGGGQDLVCSSLAVVEADSVDAWGKRIFDTPVDVPITCSADTATVEFKAPKKNAWYRLYGESIITANQASYTDEGTIVQDGKTIPVYAVVKVADGGADGGGTQSPTPTPTVTPTPTDTVTPTPTDTVTPTPTDTVTPTPTDTVTPTPTDTVTPTPTDTVTPTPTDTVTPTPTPTVTDGPGSGTPTPTAKPTPTVKPTPTGSQGPGQGQPQPPKPGPGKVLPATGAPETAGALVGASALLALGGLLVGLGLLRRREQG